MRVQEGWLARKAVREELLAAASQFGLESGVRHGAERDTAYRAQGMEPLVDVTQSSLGGTWTWHGLMVMLGHDPEEEKALRVREALRAAGHEAPPKAACVVGKGSSCCAAHATGSNAWCGLPCQTTGTALGA